MKYKLAVAILIALFAITIASIIAHIVWIAVICLVIAFGIRCVGEF